MFKGEIDKNLALLHIRHSNHLIQMICHEILRYDNRCFVEIVRNNKKIIRKLADIIMSGDYDIVEEM
jgi:ABC-type dipeptide/oligopeptide/nickel transport system ATPase subunit